MLDSAVIPDHEAYRRLVLARDPSRRNLESDFHLTAICNYVTFGVEPCPLCSMPMGSWDWNARKLNTARVGDYSLSDESVAFEIFRGGL